nr:surfeit locus protein 1 [Ipomoea batatas]
MATAVSRSVTRILLRGSAVSVKSSPFSTAAPAVSTVSQNQPSDKDNRSTWSKIFLFIPGAITFGLGTWQIFRRQEKVEMLEYRQNRLEMEPLKCNDATHSSEDLNNLEFRKVLCRGVFNEEKSVYVGPRSRSISGVTENGYYIISPLEPVSDDPESTQSAILVNRGWVPRSWRDKSLEVSENDKQPSTPISSAIPENEKSSWWRFWSKKPKYIEEEVPSVVAPVEVVGVVRGSEKPSIFVPANDPSSYQWFYVDVPAIARACGFPETTLYIEDVNENVDPSNPYPVPKDLNTLISSSVMPQDHLNYMLTWYSLSAAVTFMAFKRLKPKKGHR